MHPWGLESPLSIDLCIVSSCGFLWWSQFAIQKGFFDEEYEYKAMTKNAARKYGILAKEGVDPFLRFMTSLDLGSCVSFQSQV